MVTFIETYLSRIEIYHFFTRPSFICKPISDTSTHEENRAIIWNPKNCGFSTVLK